METLFEFLSRPWPWYVGGPLIGLMVPLLLYFLNKPLGISSSLQHVCAMCVAGDIEYFNYEWRKHTWNLLFVAGIFVGAVLVHQFFQDPAPVAISEATVADLNAFGITDMHGLAPAELFSWGQLTSPVTLILLVVGGFFVGFGTRYANGCTSGHTMMGLSMLSVGSLVATIGFFLGGLIVSWFVLPLIFSWA